MTFHYPRPEDQPQSALLDLSEAARIALGGMATIGASPAEALLTPDSIAVNFNIDPNFKAIAETAHDTYSSLFDRISITTPSLPEFAAAGVDFDRLGTAHERMQKLGNQPELVFAPSNLTLGGWEGLYANLQYDTSVNADGRIQNGGLWVNNDVKANWNKLTSSNHTLAIDGVEWQVLLLPGTPSPTHLNVDHNGKDGRKVSRALQEQATQLGIASGGLTADNMHPTIASYLALQAGKLQNNEEPIDSSHYTWLQGEFGDKSNLQAPYGYWGPVDGRVKLGWGDVGRRFDYLGVRLPVWGEVRT